MLLRIFIWLTCVTFAATVNEAAEPSLGQTLKKIFATPTPTPHRKKKAGAAKKKSPTPTPTPKTTPSPTATAKKKTSASPTSSPHRKKKPSPTASPVETSSPSPSPSPTSSTPPHRKKKSSPIPEPTGTSPTLTSPSATPSPTATPESSPTAGSLSPIPRKSGAPNATLLPNQIKGFENYPLKVQKLLTSALELTTRNLDYKYGSADPANGGMDCSGFVYYLLNQNAITDVPRDSSGQYVWLRRARLFEPVLSQKENSFELEDLKPGDLLFWTGTYAIERDPPITHAMIYLGREKKTGQRVMVGASDGRVYQGESRNGVSVFDFKVQRRETNGEAKLHPAFIGYGHIPGLQE
jgi:cell wall-associated NlpC family hydrolase